MNLPPEFIREINAAQRRRGLVYLPFTVHLCGVPTTVFNAHARLHLELVRSPFLREALGGRRDVFAFLWRLHPGYAHPRHPEKLSERPCRRGLPRLFQLWRAFGAVQPACAFFQLERHVAKLDLFEANVAVAEYMDGIFADRPPSSLSISKSLVPKPAPHWLDDQLHFFGTCFHGWSPEAIQAAPQQQLYQLWRAWSIAHGQTVIDPIAEKIGDFVTAELSRAGVN